MIKIIAILLFAGLTLNAQEKEPPGFWGIPFGTYETTAVNMMLEMDSVKAYPDCPWPVPPAEGETTEFFKSTQIFGYDIRYIVLVFKNYKFEKAYIMLKPYELEWYQHILKEFDNRYGKRIEKEDGYFWDLPKIYISLEILKFPNNGKFTDHPFITYKSKY